MTAFGAAIRNLRNKKGFSVRRLALIVEKSPGYISQIEARGEIPSPILICKLAESLDGDVEDLLRLAKESQIERVASEIDDKHSSILSLYRKKKE